MTNLSTLHGKKMINTSRIDCFFVGHFLPFVGLSNPHKLPFVCRNRPNSTNYGFTLIELIITLVIASVLLGIGVPNFRLFIQNSRITTQSNELIGAITSARSEAIKRNKTVVLCRSGNPTAATPTCAAGGSFTWETGWLVFQDANGDNIFTTAGGDTLLLSHEPIAGDNTLRGNNAQVGDFIAFTRNGVTTLTAPAAADPPHHLKLCDTRGVGNARAIVLETTGRARIDRQSTFAELVCP
jgi:type IV fimbrial biogenesis protein FimT